MFKITGLFSLMLVVSVSLASYAQEAGDPDSDSAPMNVEPETTMPVLNSDDDNPDARADDANNIKTIINNPAATAETDVVPGDHLVPKLTETTPEDKWTNMKFARLQGLNKITAKTLEIKAALGVNTKFSNMEFVVEKCQRGPENEKVENAVLIKIWDEIPGQEKKEVFHGWMFSSSPAISALEHPIYDIILLGCGDAPKVEAPVVDDKKANSKKAKKPKASITVQ